MIDPIQRRDRWERHGWAPVPSLLRLILGIRCSLGLFSANKALTFPTITGQHGEPDQSVDLFWGSMIWWKGARFG